MPLISLNPNSIHIPRLAVVGNNLLACEEFAERLQKANSIAKNDYNSVPKFEVRCNSLENWLDCWMKDEPSDKVKQLDLEFPDQHLFCQWQGQEYMKSFSMILILFDVETALSTESPERQAVKLLEDVMNALEHCYAKSDCWPAFHEDKKSLRILKLSPLSPELLFSCSFPKGTAISEVLKFMSGIDSCKDDWPKIKGKKSQPLFLAEQKIINYNAHYNMIFIGMTHAEICNFIDIADDIVAYHTSRELERLKGWKKAAHSTVKDSMAPNSALSSSAINNNSIDFCHASHEHFINLLRGVILEQQKNLKEAISHYGSLWNLVDETRDLHYALKSQFFVYVSSRLFDLHALLKELAAVKKHFLKHCDTIKLLATEQCCPPCIWLAHLGLICELLVTSLSKIHEASQKSSGGNASSSQAESSKSSPPSTFMDSFREAKFYRNDSMAFICEMYLNASTVYLAAQSYHANCCNSDVSSRSTENVLNKDAHIAFMQKEIMNICSASGTIYHFQSTAFECCDPKHSLPTSLCHLSFSCLASFFERQEPPLLKFPRRCFILCVHFANLLFHARRYPESGLLFLKLAQTISIPPGTRLCAAQVDNADHDFKVDILRNTFVCMKSVFYARFLISISTVLSILYPAFLFDLAYASPALHALNRRCHSQNSFTSIVEETHEKISPFLSLEDHFLTRETSIRVFNLLTGIACESTYSEKDREQCARNPMKTTNCSLLEMSHVADLFPIASQALTSDINYLKTRMTETFVRDLRDILAVVIHLSDHLSYTTMTSEKLPDVSYAEELHKYSLLCREIIPSSTHTQPKAASDPPQSSSPCSRMHNNFASLPVTPFSIGHSTNGPFSVSPVTKSEECPESFDASELCGHSPLARGEGSPSSNPNHYTTQNEVVEVIECASISCDVTITPIKMTSKGEMSYLVSGRVHQSMKKILHFDKVRIFSSTHACIDLNAENLISTHETEAELLEDPCTKKVSSKRKVLSVQLGAQVQFTLSLTQQTLLPLTVHTIQFRCCDYSVPEVRLSFYLMPGFFHARNLALDNTLDLAREKSSIPNDRDLYHAQNLMLDKLNTNKLFDAGNNFRKPVSSEQKQNRQSRFGENLFHDIQNISRMSSFKDIITSSTAVHLLKIERFPPGLHIETEKLRTCKIEQGPLLAFMSLACSATYFVEYLTPVHLVISASSILLEKPWESVTCRIRTSCGPLCKYSLSKVDSNTRTEFSRFYTLTTGNSIISAESQFKLSEQRETLDLTQLFNKQFEGSAMLTESAFRDIDFSVDDAPFSVLVCFTPDLRNEQYTKQHSIFQSTQEQFGVETNHLALPLYIDFNRAGFHALSVTLEFQDTYGLYKLCDVASMNVVTSIKCSFRCLKFKGDEFRNDNSVMERIQIESDSSLCKQKREQSQPVPIDPRPQMFLQPRLCLLMSIVNLNEFFSMDLQSIQILESDGRCLAELDKNHGSDCLFGCLSKLQTAEKWNGLYDTEQNLKVSKNPASPLFPSSAVLTLATREWHQKFRPLHLKIFFKAAANPKQAVKTLNQFKPVIAKASTFPISRLDLGYAETHPTLETLLAYPPQVKVGDPFAFSAIIINNSEATQTIQMRLSYQPTLGLLSINAASSYNPLQPTSPHPSLEQYTSSELGSTFILGGTIRSRERIVAPKSAVVLSWVSIAIRAGIAPVPTMHCRVLGNFSTSLEAAKHGNDVRSIQGTDSPFFSRQ